MKSLTAALTVLLTSGACAYAEAPPASVAIQDFDPAIHGSEVHDTRWQIIIHSGAGIPGSPGAQDYYRQPKQVLQAIADTCVLGTTVYIQATDGVSVLSILNDALSDEQVACIRSAEDNGLRLTDRGPR